MIAATDSTVTMALYVSLPDNSSTFEIVPMVGSRYRAKGYGIHGWPQWSPNHRCGYTEMTSSLRCAHTYLKCFRAFLRCACIFFSDKEYQWGRKVRLWIRIAKWVKRSLIYPFLKGGLFWKSMNMVKVEEGFSSLHSSKHGKGFIPGTYPNTQSKNEFSNRMVVFVIYLEPNRKRKISLNSLRV